MRFGIFDHVERRNDVGAAQQYEERRQFAATADAASFDCYHVAEHHHSPLCLTPNQAVYLAAVA
jgi:alkanesulfonate monooxygenase SsuD/methylene tetrahydromethanopterin reductase-like flavin-dependent oxidoreductase (luciferase family)